MKDGAHRSTGNTRVEDRPNGGVGCQAGACPLSGSCCAWELPMAWLLLWSWPVLGLLGICVRPQKVLVHPIIPRAELRPLARSEA